MNKLKSKCHGAKVYILYVDNDMSFHNFCSECHKLCEIEDKNKPQDTILYAALRR